MEKKHFLFYFGVVSRRLSKRVNDWNFERLAIMIIDDDWIKFCVTIYPLLRNHSGLDYRNFLYRERKRKMLFERKLGLETRATMKVRDASHIKSMKRRFGVMQEALLQHIHIVECSGGLHYTKTSFHGLDIWSTSFFLHISFFNGQFPVEQYLLLSFSIQEVAVVKTTMIP